MAKINTSKLDKFAHSYIYLAIMFSFVFLGWITKIVSITYFSIAFFLVFTPIITKDIRLLLPIVLSALIGFTDFHFNDLPISAYAAIVCLFIGLLIFIFRNILSKNVEIRFNAISKSLLLLFAVCMLASIVRNIFYNSYAFTDYVYNVPDGVLGSSDWSGVVGFDQVNFNDFSDRYNILFGYLFSLVILLIFFVSLMASSFKSEYGKEIYIKIMYVFAIVILIEVFISIGLYYINNKEALGFYVYLKWCEKNMYAVAIESILPFLIAGFAKNKKRIDFLLVALILATTVFFVGSRGGELTIICMLPFVAYVILNKHPKIFWILFTSFALVAIALVIFVSPIKTLFISAITKFTDLTGRKVFWTWIYEYTYNNGLLVAIFGGSPALLFELWNPWCYLFSYQQLGTTSLLMCHSNVMQMMAMAGTLGLVSYAFLIIESVSCASKEESEWKIPMMMLIVVGLVHGLVDNVLYNVFYIIPFIMLFSDTKKKFFKLF